MEAMDKCASNHCFNATIMKPETVDSGERDAGRPLGNWVVCGSADDASMTTHHATVRR